MRGKDKKDPVAPCLLRLLYCVFLQFAINLLDQSAIWQSAVFHLFCQLKMPCQRYQLIVRDSRKLSAGKLCEVGLAVGRHREAILLAGHAEELQVKGNVVPHQRVFAQEGQKALQGFPGVRFPAAAPQR